VTDRLESLGVTVVLLQPQTHADVRHSLELLAQLLGTPQQYLRVWAGVQHDIEQAALRVPVGLRGRRVYFEVGSTPYAAGAGSFIGETLSRLGMGNLVPAELGPFPKLNPEFVVRGDPDIVMAAQRDLQGMAERPGWQDMSAFKAGTTCGFEPAQYDILVRPGPRMGEAALILADCLVRLAGRGGEHGAGRQAAAGVAP
jgi:iron complex transport system substrate-binding protein